MPIDLESFTDVMMLIRLQAKFSVGEIFQEWNFPKLPKSVICYAILADMNLESINWMENSSSTLQHKLFPNFL